MRSAFILLAMLGFLSCSSVYKKEEARQLAPASYLELLEAYDTAHLLDIRTGMEYRKGHLDGFRNVNYLGLSFHKKIDSLDKSIPVFIYCQTAHRSPLVAKELIKKGFTEIIDLEGGYKNLKRWEESNPPSSH